MKKFKILARETICDNPWISVEKQRVVLPDGDETDWFLTRGHQVVIVVPFLVSGEVCLQKAYKHGAGEVIFEFCAGMIESGEEPQEAAARELAEETGLCAQEMIFVGEAFGNPTGSNTKYFFFVAKGCEVKSRPHLDAAEQIENFTVSHVAEAKKLLCLNPSSSGAIAAIVFAEEYLQGLKNNPL